MDLTTTIITFTIFSVLYYIGKALRDVYFTKEKNIDLLIQCANIFQEKYPQCKLLLIGEIEDETTRQLVENHQSIIGAMALSPRRAWVYHKAPCARLRRTTRWSP